MNDAPQKFSFADFVDELRLIAAECEADHRVFHHPSRKRRADLLDRFSVLLDIHKAKVIPILRGDADKRAR